jgi:CRP-like cAMP-binding protein
VLFRTGEPGDEMFLIYSGSIVVSKPVTGRVEQVLRRMEPGEAFGEMSLFGDEQTRSATIQAETDVILLGLHRENLSEFIESNPRDAAKFFLAMIRISFKRLRDTSDLVAEVTRWGLEATGLDVEHK